MEHVMEDELYRTGIAIREQMFGPEGAQAKVDGASDFTRDFEEVVTRFCFGATWGREGLTPAERSMLTLAMLIALGRAHEIGIHVQGAVANGVSREKIRELLLHAVPYCGIPAAFDGFRAAEPILDELEAA
jgi:4-carboxymuconolactone decarboxylase